MSFRKFRPVKRTDKRRALRKPITLEGQQEDLRERYGRAFFAALQKQVTVPGDWQDLNVNSDCTTFWQGWFGSEGTDYGIRVSLWVNLKKGTFSVTLRCAFYEDWSFALDRWGRVVDDDIPHFRHRGGFSMLHQSPFVERVARAINRAVDDGCLVAYATLTTGTKTMCRTCPKQLSCL